MENCPFRSFCTSKIHSLYEELFLKKKKKTRLKDDSLRIHGIICCYAQGKLILCESFCTFRATEPL